MHVNDWEPGDDHANRLPGDGVIPLADVLRAVEATGYLGTYDNEYMYDARLVDSDPERYAPDAVVAARSRP